MTQVEVFVTIEVCNKRKSLVAVLETKEIAPFAQRLLEVVATTVNEVKAETKAEDKRQASLAQEYRRGHLAGVEEGIKQERRNEQSGNYRAYHCTHHL